jgi:hypothetical protein
VNIPCTCHEHRDGAPTTYGEHEFARDWDETQDVGGSFFEVWRWLCSCGARGRWQSQSDNVPYHSWLRHCGVPHDYAGGAR